jgi:hypothetical protein
MGIEPTREALPSLYNKRLGATANAKRDWRVNFRGMCSYVRLRRDISMRETPGSSPSVVGLWPASLRHWISGIACPSAAVRGHETLRPIVQSQART